MIKTIPYLEVISPTTFKPIEIVEPKECWFELSFFEVGEFEVYAPATQRNLKVLKNGNFVKIPKMRYIWVITSIEYTFTAGGSRMISAKGFECKWLLQNCIIHNSSLALPKTVSAAFVRLFERFFKTYYQTGYGVELINIDTEISDPVATRGNLLEFLNKMTKTYGCGINAVYSVDQINFRLLQGQDRSATIKFSQSRDNLLSFKYLSDATNIANTAFVVAKVNDKEYSTSFSYVPNEPKKTIIIVESNQTNKYIDEVSDEITLDLTKPSDFSLFSSWLQEEGKLALANHINKTKITSEIDLINSNYVFETDYQLGDIVEVKDEYFNITAKPRIVKYTIALESTGKVTEALEFDE